MAGGHVRDKGQRGKMEATPPPAPPHSNKAEGATLDFLREKITIDFNCHILPIYKFLAQIPRNNAVESIFRYMTEIYCRPLSHVMGKEGWGDRGTWNK